MNAPHENSAARYPAADRARLLRSLEAHAGFIFFTERITEKIAKDIEAKVWDVKTTDDEARILREVRKRLVYQFSPGDMLASMIAAADEEAVRDKSAKG